MDALQRIEILQLLMAMFIPNVGILLVAIAVNNDQKEIFSEIGKPLWTPPLWLFTFLWSFFFCILGSASNLVFKNREKEGKWTALTKAALVTYGINVIFSWLWGLIFFFKEDIILALINIALIDVMSLHLVYLFYKVKTLAGYLVIPYISWLSFVTILNCALVAIN